MNARMGSGIELHLGEQDLNVIREQGYVRAPCDHFNGYSFSVVLRVGRVADVDAYTRTFPWYEPPRCYGVPEPGWFVETTPDAALRRENSKLPIEVFRITITDARFLKLLDQGHIGTRTVWDRLDLVYWEECMPARLYS